MAKSFLCVDCGTWRVCSHECLTALLLLRSQGPRPECSAKHVVPSVHLCIQYEQKLGLLVDMDHVSAQIPVLAKLRAGLLGISQNSSL